jgi:hypothetical protein
MLHPLLPYQFELFFKDRQVAHIELEFCLLNNNGKNSVVVRRKISSGNLEADLLSSRFMNHYLFIQQNRFPSDIWQSIKIQLSTQK